MWSGWQNNPKKLSPLPPITKISSDITCLIESTIQQSIVCMSMKEPDYYTMLGGGKTPPEQGEAYQNELKDLDAESANHNRLLIDKSGKTDALFYIRKANSNQGDTASKKLLINKVILAWKHILQDKLEISNYITAAFLRIVIKAQLNPTLYDNSWRNFLLYHLPDTLCTRSFDPTSVKIPMGHRMKCMLTGHQSMTALHPSFLGNHPWCCQKYNKNHYHPENAEINQF
jgi:hypothetical protein